MSEEFRRRIFEPFSQERTDARSVYTGTGLGMSIVKGLVDAMGGMIDVQSAPNVGTTFTVTLPFRIAAESEIKSTPETAEANIEGKHLLLAEDNELNAEIAVSLLEDAGATVTVAENGKAAVEAVEEHAAGTYDAILMDIMMPVMNGFEATKKIRKMQDFRKAFIPIIAMTANAFDEDKQKALDAGMNAHVSKPIELPLLLKTLAEVMKNG